jgi:hypothetical protein
VLVNFAPTAATANVTSSCGGKASRPSKTLRSVSLSCYAPNNRRLRAGGGVEDFLPRSHSHEWLSGNVGGQAVIERGEDNSSHNVQRLPSTIRRHWLFQYPSLVSRA